MAAYVIVDLDVEELSLADDYRRQALPVFKQFGGRTLIRLGTPEVLERDWRPHRIMGLEFATMEALKQWWTSDEYRPLVALRQCISKANVIAVNGV